MIDYDPGSFNAFEAEGWELAAQEYAGYLADMTQLFVDRLLDAAGVEAGMKVLDVATGPGQAAARSAERGAHAVGVDVAGAMVRLAASRYPNVEFRQGDAEALPFATDSFDAAVCNFGLLHLGRPELGVKELARVVSPGGRAALAVWDVPERCRLFGLILEAVAEADVEPPSNVPAGPSFFRFADDDEFASVLRSAGFSDITIETVERLLAVESADRLWRGLLDGTVRTRALIVGQTSAARSRLRDAFDRGVAREGSTLRLSVKLASGRTV